MNQKSSVFQILKSVQRVLWLSPPFVGCLKLELRGHSILVQFHSGCDAAYPHVGAVVVVSPKPFVAHSFVLPLNVSVLLRFF